MVTPLTPVVPYPTPHITTGLESLGGRLAGRAGLAYGVVDGQLK